MCCTAKARCLTTLSYSVAVAYAAYLKAQGFTATVACLRTCEVARNSKQIFLISTRQ